MNQIDGIQIQIKKGLIEYAVLALLKKGELYSSEIIEQMKDIKLLTSEGTIYPLLSRLKDEGLCEYYWRESEMGPPRKYFIITDKGKDKLLLFSESWSEISKAINILVDQNE